MMMRAVEQWKRALRWTADEYRDTVKSRVTMGSLVGACVIPAYCCESDGRRARKKRETKTLATADFEKSQVRRVSVAKRKRNCWKTTCQTELSKRRRRRERQDSLW